MQFLVIAHDDTAEATLERRMGARAEHLAGVRSLAERGHMLDGGQIVDAHDRVTGSVMLCDFPDRAALDQYLENDIYTRAKVWNDITVLNLRRIDRDALKSAIPKLPPG
jgi:uncharacterized protein YciI